MKPKNTKEIDITIGDIRSRFFRNNFTKPNKTTITIAVGSEGLGMSFDITKDDAIALRTALGIFIKTPDNFFSQEI